MAKSVEDRFYPERAAGGFSHTDGSIAFYARVAALLEPEMTAVDFGAGFGSSISSDTIGWRRALRQLRGKCRRAIALDVDPRVLENPFYDERLVIDPSEPLPLADASVDLIVADCVFEHVEDPGAVAAELDRVLRPGGWLCVRTPNRWGYIGIGTNLVPNRWHARLLGWLQPGRMAEGVYPTRYRLNTRRAFRRYFPEARWLHAIHTMNNEPAYFGRSRLAWSLMLLLFRLTPREFAGTWYAYFQKRPADGG